MEIATIIKNARRFRKQAKLEHRKFARVVGFRSDNTLTKMDEKDWNPTKKTLETLERFLGNWQPGDPITDDHLERAA